MKKIIRHPLCLTSVLSCWWLFFFCLALFQASGFREINDNSIILFSVFIASFFLGGGLSSYANSGHYLRSIKTNIFLGQKISRQGRNVVLFLLLTLLLWQFLVMLRLGFFEYSYVEYNKLIRASEEVEYITGGKYKDHFYKLIVYPSLVLIYLIALVGSLSGLVTLGVVVNLVVFSVIWQVNYPLILVVYTLSINYVLFSLSWINKSIIPLLALGLLLIVAAFIRYGGASWGVFEHYFVGYNTIGFVFFDSKLNDSSSVLHEFSYGRSLLGAIDQYLDLFFRSLGSDYLSASLQNVNDNSHQVDIGAHEEKLVNAFGTMAFTFYRDFWWAGVMILPFIYGYTLISCYSKSHVNWRHRALFFLLCYGWITGNTVSPFDQVYFVFAAIFLFFIGRFKVSKSYC